MLYFGFNYYFYSQKDGVITSGVYVKEMAKTNEISKSLTPKQQEILDKINREYPKYTVFTSKNY